MMILMVCIGVRLVKTARSFPPAPPNWADIMYTRNMAQATKAKAATTAARAIPESRSEHLLHLEPKVETYP